MGTDQHGTGFRTDECGLTPSFRGSCVSRDDDLTEIHFQIDVPHGEPGEMLAGGGRLGVGLER